MCEFLSAVKSKTKTGEERWYFLTYNLIHNTPMGKLLQKKYRGDDLIGHTPIRDYFNLRESQGKNWECADFSTPDNFPPVIVKSIKLGEFRGLGVSESLLSQSSMAEYNKIKCRAWASHMEISWQVAKYEKIRQQAFWDLFSILENRAEAWK